MRQDTGYDDLRCSPDGAPALLGRCSCSAGTSFDDIEVSGEVTLTDLIQQATGLHPERKFADVISTCSLLLGEQPA
ncbi:MAG: hypothetical protein R2709_13090 [Marmoricola sp.]